MPDRFRNWVESARPALAGIARGSERFNLLGATYGAQIGVAILAVAGAVGIVNDLIQQTRVMENIINPTTTPLAVAAAAALGAIAGARRIRYRPFQS